MDLLTRERLNDVFKVSIDIEFSKEAQFSTKRLRNSFTAQSLSWNRGEQCQNLYEIIRETLPKEEKRSLRLIELNLVT